MTATHSTSESETIFSSTFSAEERRALLEEDRQAQLSISAILSFVIAIGMLLGIFSVLLISRLGF